LACMRQYVLVEKWSNTTTTTTTTTTPTGSLFVPKDGCLLLIYAHLLRPGCHYLQFGRNLAKIVCPAAKRGNLV